MRRAWPVALVLVLAAALATAQRASSPILVLISFDGFRWDYIDRGESPNLKALAARGVRAHRLVAVRCEEEVTVIGGDDRMLDTRRGELSDGA